MAQPEYGDGFLRTASAADVAEANRRTEEEKSALDKTNADVQGLSSYLWGIWEQNRVHKEEESGIQEQMLANLRARNNEYTDAKKAEIERAGMPDVYMGLTNVKCAHAEAWLMDIFSSSERTWGIQPTPEPDPVQDVQEKVLTIVSQQLQKHLQEGGGEVTPEQFNKAVQDLIPVAEEAVNFESKKRAQKMETKIYDQLTEGGWDVAFEDLVSDIVTLKAGIVKGPIVRKHKRIEYVDGKRKVVEQDRPEYWRVNPLDAYPAPFAESFEDGAFIEKVRFSRRDLITLKDEEGYDDKVIDDILENFPQSPNFYNSVDQERRDDLEDKEDDEYVLYREDIEGLEFWCSVQGKSLIEYGLDKIPGAGVDNIKPLEEYDINAIMVGNQLVYVALNDDELGRRPYSKTGWRKIPGSFWYKGVPELMEDLQRIINAAVRSMVYNMSMAAGPQVDIDVDRLVPGEDLESAYPGKVWQTMNRGNISAPAVRFFNPNSNSAELFNIYENFARLADDYTGIPAYAYGSDRVAGAGRTSSGLSMLMTSAAKGIKRVILAIDNDILKTVVHRQFDWNMQYDEDMDIKGDLEVVTTGAVAVMVKEQMSERRMQFLAATNNEVDVKLTGMEGRANVLREAAAALEMEGSKVVLDPDDVREMAMADEENNNRMAELEEQAMQMEHQLRMQGLQLDNQFKQVQMQVEQMKMQVEQQKLQVEAEKLAIERERLAVEAAKAQANAQLAGMKTQADIEKGKIDSEVKAAQAVAQAEANAMATRSKVAKEEAEVTKLGMDMLTESMAGEDEMEEEEAPESGETE